MSWTHSWTNQPKAGAKLRSLDGVGRHRRLCGRPCTLRFLACIDPGRKYLRPRQPSSSSLQSNYLLSPSVDQYSIRRPRVPNVGLPPPSGTTWPHPHPFIFVVSHLNSQILRGCGGDWPAAWPLAAAAQLRRGVICSWSHIDASPSGGSGRRPKALWHPCFLRSSKECAFLFRPKMPHARYVCYFSSSVWHYGLHFTSDF
jgi:hypothetical protein